MSARLLKAIESGSVRVRKIVSGEVAIKFDDRTIPDVHLQNHHPVDLTKISGVTAAECKHSNISWLASRNYIEIL